MNITQAAVAVRDSDEGELHPCEEFDGGTEEVVRMRLVGGLVREAREVVGVAAYAAAAEIAAGFADEGEGDPVALDEGWMSRGYSADQGVVWDAIVPFARRKKGG